MNNTYKTNKTDWRRLVRSTLLVALLLGGNVTAWGQSVIMSDNSYFLKHNDEGTSIEGTASTGFNPSTCIWYINSNTVQTANASGVAFGGNSYLQTGSATLGSSATWTQAQNGSLMRATNNNYLRRRNSNSNWTIDATDNHRATAYETNISSQIGNFTISGDAVISTTGTNSSYTHTIANYYDIYSFNSLTYYSTDPSAAASTTAPTSGLPTLTTGYTWSLSSNSYATVNATTGAITLNSLPATDQDVTLTCSVTRNGVTKSATKTITLEAPKVDPTSISITSSNSMTAYVGNTSNITYSLTPSPCYNNVTFSSANTGIATVNGSGVVTGVATGTTTITVTALKIDGTTTSALTKTVSVTVKDKVATPVIAFTPTVADAGATATAEITCSTPGTAIYYTVNGNDPTSSSTLYNNTFTLNDGDIVKAIAIKTTDATYWDNSDIASRTYTACSTTAPVITYTQSGSTATVTITAEDGATIYYTTNGNNPTESSTNGTTTVTINSVTNGTTVKAFAKSGTCQASAIVSKEIITSNVSTSVVTLYDYEDHNWAYYNKELNSPIRSWNPADVKITYYGEGKMYTSTSTTPSGDLSNVTSGTVRVGILTGETQNTFVYYKTLERTDGQTAANPSGRCAYRTIPNPFSVRPTFTSGNTKYYTGFYKWRVKKYSGGRIYTTDSGGDSVRVGGTVDAEQVLYFAPTSEYGMTVELEALWARAYVTTSSTNMTTYVTGTNADERNFHIVTAANQTASNYQKSYPVTISARYPDGTSGGGSLSGGFTAAANTKFEYVTISASNGTYSANCNNLVIGRGCSGSTINIVRGLEGNQTSDVSYSIRLESGTIVSFWPSRKDATTFSGKLSTVSTIGCDYDRASGTNTLLHIMPNVSGGTNTYFVEGGGGANTFNGSGNRNNITYDWFVKSGKIQENVSINTADPFYLGNYVSSQDANSVKYIGKRRLTVEGGEMGTVAAGIGPYGTNYSNYTVDDGTWTVLIRLKGGTVNGAIYGAGVYTGASGDRLFVFTGGTVKGWVAGGCNGTQNTGGELYGETFIYVGGTTKLDGTAATVGSSNGGHIFGAGSGINGGTTVGRVNSSNIVVADEAEIARDVYGGGNYGYVRAGTGNKSDIYILGGTVNGKVFGGSNQQQGQIVNIYMKGGRVIGGVYGGSNSSGTVAGPVNVAIEGGTVGVSGQGAEVGHVFGSGYGSGTSVSGNVQVTIGKSDDSHSDSPLIWGNVYGGGHNAAYTSTSNTFQVLGQNGLVKGSIFGGGKGSTATITGPTDVLLKGHITVEGNVYGGGDAAAVSGNTSVRLQD